ncbi:hypothetical protein P8452_66811 [Trifolium repens]|nr:hypothetical protein P8452_66811 [Trifolium repens]
MKNSCRKSDLQFAAVDVLSFGERAMNVLWDLEAFEPLDSNSIGYFFPRVFVLFCLLRSVSQTCLLSDDSILGFAVLDFFDLLLSWRSISNCVELKSG